MAAEKIFRVLIATDGSTQAKAALFTAVRFPWPVATRVMGVTARPLETDYRNPVLAAALDQSIDRIVASAHKGLLRRWPDAEVKVLDAEPVDGVLREAGRLRADVIVLGWRGHGAVRRLLMGSVSRGIARGAKCAILLIKRRQQEVRRIVLGFDGSANAHRAVAFVGRLPPARGGQVTLVTSVEHMEIPSQALVPGSVRAMAAAEVRRVNAERSRHATEEVARVAQALSRAGWRTRTVVTSGAPLRNLLDTVDAGRADLLVVGARGVSGVRQLLLGSVAEGALQRCPVAVLVVR